MKITLKDMISWNQNDSMITDAMMHINEAASTKDMTLFITAVDDAQKRVMQALRSNLALREEIKSRS